MECIFMGYRWFPNRKKPVDVGKLATDIGAPKDQVQKVIDRCEKDSRNDAGAMDFFVSLLRSSETKAAFNKFLQEREAKFFKDKLCD